jgi:hypothetical protein
MVTTRLVLVLPISPETFAQYASSFGWRPSGEVEPKEGHSDVGLLRVRYQSSDGEVIFTSDELLETQCLDIVADPTGLIEQTVRGELVCYDLVECLRVVQFDEAEETVCRALELLAATVPEEFHQEVFDLASAALRDPREQVRIDGLHIPRYTRWQQFLPIIEHLAVSDPSTRVRGFASNIRQILQIQLGRTSPTSEG